jgi:hypothetical protein
MEPGVERAKTPGNQRIRWHPVLPHQRPAHTDCWAPCKANKQTQKISATLSLPTNPRRIVLQRCTHPCASPGLLGGNDHSSRSMRIAGPQDTACHDLTNPRKQHGPEKGRAALFAFALTPYPILWHRRHACVYLFSFSAPPTPLHALPQHVHTLHPSASGLIPSIFAAHVAHLPSRSMR